jgi:hypothetical protein
MMSMYGLIQMGFMPLGSMLVGAVGEVIGVPLTEMIGGLLSALVILIVAARVPVVRSLE